MAARPDASPTAMPRVCRPNRCGVAAVAAVIVPADLRATARATRWQSACERAKAPIRCAMNSASSLTQPSSAEPRVCCQGRPRKYSPGTSVTPRSCLTCPRVVEDGQLDERVVEPEARRPHDASTASVGAVGERHRRALRRRSRAAACWMPCLRARARAGADERLAVLQPLTDARGHGLAHQAGRFEIAEQVPAEDALGKRRLARRRPRGGPRATAASSAAIWKPVFPPPTTSTAPGGQVARRAVVAAVQLHHFGAEASGDRRRERHLERPGGDHDLVGLVRPVGELDEEAAVVAAARTATRLSSSTGSSKRRA